MFENNSTTIGNHPIEIGEYPIAEMTGALARVEAEIAADPLAYAGPGAYEPEERHSALLQTIAETPAKTVADVKAKAEALAMELKKSYAWDCEGEGTARVLAESIVRDLLALK